MPTLGPVPDLWGRGSSVSSGQRRGRSGQRRGARSGQRVTGLQRCTCMAQAAFQRLRSGQ
jgi:hypothetical protein